MKMFRIYFKSNNLEALNEKEASGKVMFSNLSLKHGKNRCVVKIILEKNLEKFSKQPVLLYLQILTCSDEQ